MIGGRRRAGKNGCGAGEACASLAGERWTVTKADVLALLERMPEEIDVNDFIYRLYVIERIEQGERARREGRVVSHEEAVRRMRSWQSSRRHRANLADGREGR